MASTYLYRTQVAGTSTQKFTFSAWFKRTGLTNDYSGLLNCYTGDANRNGIYFGTNAKLNVYFRTSSSSQIYYETNKVFKDVSAWYHIVVAVDTTDSTVADRVKIYINGVRLTSFSASTQPNANSNFSCIGTNNLDLEVGRMQYGSTNTKYFDGLMSHVHFTDGYVYTPSTFGSTDATTGEWKIKTDVTGVTYGNNGFWILKDDNSNLDRSGENHHQTISGTLTKTEDNPSNNFATINSLNRNAAASYTFTNSSNVVTINAVDAAVPGTLGAKSGKYYWEQKWTQQGGNDRWGIMPDDALVTTHPRATGVGWDQASNQFYLLGSAVSGSWGSSIGTGDIIQIALDLDNNALYLGVNGTYRNSGDPTSGSSRTGAVDFSASSLVGKFLLPGFGKGNQGTSTMQYNFGNGYFGTTAISSAGTNASNNGLFEYDVPAGYTALSTKGLNT
tara:strand:- start:596 stop:1933 length:1338 start_codon:yes stop_codon:yes gene_type:complete